MRNPGIQAAKNRHYITGENVLRNGRLAQAQGDVTRCVTSLQRQVCGGRDQLMSWSRVRLSSNSESVPEIWKARIGQS
jgi:hypothetical protein